MKTATDKSRTVGARAARTALERLDGDAPGKGLSATIDRHVVLGAKVHAKLRTRAMALRSLVQASLDTVGEDSEARFASIELK